MMKHFLLTLPFLFLAYIPSWTLFAQDVDIQKVAYNILEGSYSNLNSSLPYDFGNMALLKTSMNGQIVNYYYSCKDDVLYSDIISNKVLFKERLLKMMTQTYNMEFTFMLCIDAKISIVYHFWNNSGDETTITYSLSDLKDFIGHEITAATRSDVLKEWLPVAFSAAAGQTSMAYQGMTDNTIMFSLLCDDIDVNYMNGDSMESIVKDHFYEKSPSVIFDLLCIYTGKGESLTVIDSKTDAQKTGKISFLKLCEVYNSAEKGVSIYDYVDEAPEEEDVPIPYQLVEVKPTFSGGDLSQFSKWVDGQLVYPDQAKKNGIEGRVTLQFTVNVDGSLTDVKVLRGVHPSLDAEAVRVVESSPLWTPGIQHGKYAKVAYTFPVIFALTKGRSR